MLGQPMPMLIPEVIGFKLTGALPEGATATDLGADRHRDAAQEGRGGQVRRVLRPRPGALALADRATIANMAPEYGATMGFFPCDAEALRLPALHGPPRNRRGSVEAYAKAQGLLRTDDTPEPALHRHPDLDLGTVESPRRAQAPAGPRARRRRETRVAQEPRVDARRPAERRRPQRLSNWVAEGGANGAGRSPSLRLVP